MFLSFVILSVSIKIIKFLLQILPSHPIFHWIKEYKLFLCLSHFAFMDSKGFHVHFLYSNSKQLRRYAMRILIVLLITLSPLILVNCSKNQETPLASPSIQSTNDSDDAFLTSNFLKQSNNVLLPIPQTPDSIYLYHRFHKFLLSYNTKTFEPEQPFDVFQQSFFYNFNFSPSNLFAAGNSEKNHYRILEVSNKQIKPVYTPKNPERTAIFPIAKNENLSIFNEIHYDEKWNALKNVLLILEKNEIRKISQDFGAIHSGVLQENTLFYTVYEPKLDQYDLYAYDLQKKYPPKKVEEGLVLPDLFLHNGKIYRSNYEKIYLNDDAFTYHAVNQFIDTYHLLLQIYTDENNQLFLDITDTRNKNILFTLQDPIDYVITENDLIIYCKGTIETIPLKNFKN